MGILTNSEDPNEYCGISSGPALFVKLKKIFRPKIHFFKFLPDTPIYLQWTIPSFFVSDKKEKSISIQRVKRYNLSVYSFLHVNQ